MRKTKGLFMIVLAAALCALLLMQVAPVTAEGGFHATQYAFWYMAEGCTAGGFETWIMVLNPDSRAAMVNVVLYTGTGTLNPVELQDIPLAPRSRMTVLLNTYVTSYDVSTQVYERSGNALICERATYGPGRAWAHDSIGAPTPLGAWWMAEGSTAGGMETWLLMMNPSTTDAHVDVTLMTESGPVTPTALQNYTVPAERRVSVNLGDYVTTYDVSTKVSVIDGGVVCERSMYGPGRAWATSSVASGTPNNEWYLAEGSTAGGMETWVLVQNPQAYDQQVSLTLMTESGPQAPTALQNYTVPAGHRVSFNLGDYVTSYDVSTKVTSTPDAVVAERAMYGPGRAWAHNSIGSWKDSYIWYMAEGATWGDMETWVLVQNPNPTDAHISVILLTNAGDVAPPALQNYTLPAGRRVSFNIAAYLDEADFGVEVYSLDTDVVAERSMYGNGRQWGTCTIGFIP
jgi:hypothetical protein